MCALPTGSFEGASCQLSDEAMSAVGSGRAYINVTTATAPAGGVSHLLPLLCPAMPSCRVGLLALGRDGTPFVPLVLRKPSFAGCCPGELLGQVLNSGVLDYSTYFLARLVLEGSGNGVSTTPAAASSLALLFLNPDSSWAVLHFGVTGASPGPHPAPHKV